MGITYIVGGIKCPPLLSYVPGDIDCVGRRSQEPPSRKPNCVQSIPSLPTVRKWRFGHPPILCEKVATLQVFPKNKN